MKARIFAVIASLILLTHLPSARGQGTSFTYQGHLNSNGASAAGNFDFQFGLYTNVATGNLVTSLVTNSDIIVSNGLFTTALSFGNVFNGASCWLEIGVRTNGSTGAFMILTPRQMITPAPYAIMANSASNLLGTLPATQLSGALPASAVAGAFSNAVTFINATNIFVGNGFGLTTLLQTNYLYVTDSSVQEIGTANTFQNITTSTQLGNTGWGFSSTGVFTAQQNGIYLVQYQIEVQNGQSTASGVNIAFGARALLNSATEITGSESFINIPPAFGEGILTKSFLVAVIAGQTVSLQIASNATGTFAYIASGTFAGENYPGVTLTILRIQ
ncbi:MAG TPA: hypothetical protein VH413_14475 [Verrucomicrobiae bacterium]|jgi:hypothetical protein|nr:hypothetical protein [Verrucomicrobiae bacterium]